MAVKFSQQKCKDELDKQAIKILVATAAANEDISLVDGGAGEDTIVGGSAIDFLTKGFKPGDAIYILNAAASADEIEAVQCVALTATQINLPTGSFTTGEANSTSLIILAADGGSTKNLLNNFNVTIFTGTQPDSPDDASNDKGTATPLITWYGGVFGSASWNAADLQAEMAITEGISANADNTGSGTWFRVWLGTSAEATTKRDAAATTLIRMDGSCGVSSGDLRLTTVTFTSGQPYTFNSFNQIAKMLGVSV